VDELKILLHEEVQFLAWGDGRNSGPWVKFRLADPSLLEVFRGLDTATQTKAGHILHLTVAEGDIATLPAERQEGSLKGRFSEEAEALHKSRVFGLVEFASAVGTDAEYHAWIQRQKSCVSHQYSEYVDGEGRCIAAHVRRASDAGTAFKPEFHQVPLTDAEHQLQHASGENEVLRRAGILDARADAGMAGKDWFYEKAFSYRQRWVWETLKAQLGYDHWYDVPPATLAQWAQERGLLSKLPRCYRRALEETQE